MIFPGVAAGQANAGAVPPKVAFLQIPDMIKLGETWKFIELPGVDRPREAGGGFGERGPRHALRPGEQRPAARRGDGRGPQGPGRLRRQERGACSRTATARHREVPRRPSPAPAMPWSRHRRPPRTSSATTNRSWTAWSRPCAPATYPQGRKVLDDAHRQGRQARLLLRV